MELYPTFLDAGYSPNLFWELSYGEIIDVIESYRRRQNKKIYDYKDELKAKAVMNNVLAKQIVELVAAGLTGSNEVTKLSEYFPMLFEDVKPLKDVELELNKAKMEEYAYWHNKQRKGGKS